jgi:hypothetical protein
MRPSRQLLDGPNRWEYGSSFPNSSDATAQTQPCVNLYNSTGGEQRNIDQANSSRYASVGGNGPPFTYDPINRRAIWAWFYAPTADINYSLPEGDKAQTGFLTFQFFSIDTGLFSPPFVPAATINQSVCTWNPATVYAIGATVAFFGHAFIAHAAGSGNTPTGTDPQWSAHNWSNATAYAIGDVVGISGLVDAISEAFISLQAHTGHDPRTSPTFWQMAADGLEVEAVYPTDDAKIIVLYTRDTNSDGQYNPDNVQLYAAVYDSGANAITARNILVSTDAERGSSGDDTRVHSIGGFSDGLKARLFYRIDLSNSITTISHRPIASDGTLGDITTLPCGDRTGPGILTTRRIFDFADDISPSFQNVYRRGEDILTSGSYGDHSLAAPAFIKGTPANAPVWTIETLAPATAPVPSVYNGLIEANIVPAVYPFPPPPATPTLFNARLFGSAPFAADPAYDATDLFAWIETDKVKARIRQTDGTWKRNLAATVYVGIQYLWPVNDTRTAREGSQPQGPGIFAATAAAASNDNAYTLLDPAGGGAAGNLTATFDGVYSSGIGGGNL